MLIYRLTKESFAFIINDVPYYSENLSKIKSMISDSTVYARCTISYFSYIIMDDIELLTNIKITTNETIELEESIITSIVDVIYTKLISNSLFINDSLMDNYFLVPNKSTLQNSMALHKQSKPKQSKSKPSNPKKDESLVSNLIEYFYK